MWSVSFKIVRSDGLEKASRFQYTWFASMIGVGSSKGMDTSREVQMGPEDTV